MWPSSVGLPPAWGIWLFFKTSILIELHDIVVCRFPVIETAENEDPEGKPFTAGRQKSWHKVLDLERRHGETKHVCGM